MTRMWRNQESGSLNRRAPVADCEQLHQSGSRAITCDVHNPGPSCFDMAVPVPNYPGQCWPGNNLPTIAPNQQQMSRAVPEQQAVQL
jgi:hypothetical protein